MNNIISAIQAGKILGLKRQSITALIRKGELNATRPPNAGKTTGYKIKIVDVYVLLQKRNAPKTEKRCPRCEQIKDLNEFNHSRSRKGGYGAYCRLCRKAQYQEDIDRNRARSREYAQRNKEAIRERRAARYNQHKDEINTERREYREKNKDEINANNRDRYATDTEYREKIKEQVRQYRKENPEKVKQSFRKWYQQHKEEQSEYARAYRKAHRQELARKSRERLQNNPEYRARVRAYIRKYKALKRGASTAELVDRQSIIERDNATCYICGIGPLTDSEIHLDHIIPLSKSGSHTPDNIKVSCASCNLKKNDRSLTEVHERIAQGKW